MEYPHSWPSTSNERTGFLLRSGHPVRPWPLPESVEEKRASFAVGAAWIWTGPVQAPRLVHSGEVDVPVLDAMNQGRTQVEAIQMIATSSRPGSARRPHGGPQSRRERHHRRTLEADDDPVLVIRADAEESRVPLESPGRVRRLRPLVTRYHAVRTPLRPFGFKEVAGKDPVSPSIPARGNKKGSFRSPFHCNAEATTLAAWPTSR